MLRFLPVTALVLALAALAGCDGGYTTEEAEVRCRSINPVGQPCGAYDACVECYEECGDDCAEADSCPKQYSCQN